MTGVILAVGLALAQAQATAGWSAVGGAFVPTTTIKVHTGGGFGVLATPRPAGHAAARQRGSYAATLDWDLNGTDDAGAILAGTHPFWIATNWTIGG